MVIVFGGMIGVGKSSYSEALAKRLGTEVFYESVDDNPILEKFYEDPKRWAFSLQIYFLNKRFESIKRALYDKNTILDRSIYEDALFTYINHLEGNISKEDMNIYAELLDNMMEELQELPKKAPDVLVYLTCSFDTILKHIIKRGRECEKFEIGDDLYQYYRTLYDHYHNWYENYDKSPKICINVDEFDVIENEERAINEVIKQMELAGVPIDR